MWLNHSIKDEEEQRDAAAAAACANGPVESSGPVPIPGAASASAAGRPSLGPIGSRKSSAQWRRESVTIVEGVEEAAPAEDAGDEGGLELDKEPVRDVGPPASTQLTLNAPQQQKGELTWYLVLVIKSQLIQYFT